MATARSRPFLTGFLVVLAAFAVAGAVDAQLKSDCGLLGLVKLARCHDDTSRAGFPLQFYEEGGEGYAVSESPFPARWRPFAAGEAPLATAVR